MVDVHPQIAWRNIDDSLNLTEITRNNWPDVLTSLRVISNVKKIGRRTSVIANLPVHLLTDKEAFMNHIVNVYTDPSYALNSFWTRDLVLRRWIPEKDREIKMNKDTKT